MNHIPPANLRISPPDFEIAFTNNSIYLLITNAVNSGPSVPNLERLSVKLVKPDMSVNMTTDLKDYLAGNSLILYLSEEILFMLCMILYY